jgi:hypothetical protein
METANELLRNVRDINRLRGDKGDKDKASRPSGRPYTEGAHVTSPSMDSQMGGAIDRLKLTGAEPGAVDSYGRPVTSPAPDRYYQQQQQQQAQPLPRPPTGARIPVPPGYPQDVRPPPGAYDPGVQGSIDGYTPAGYSVSIFHQLNQITSINLTLLRDLGLKHHQGQSSSLLWRLRWCHALQTVYLFLRCQLLPLLLTECPRNH